MESRELTELMRGWKPPVELGVSSPREVKLSAGGIGIACLAAVLVLLAVAAAVTLSRLRSSQLREKRVLAESGVLTEAVVTRRFRANDKEHQPRITYEFRHEGQTYRKSTNTPESIWKGLAPGSTIEVRFLPGDPMTNHPTEWEPGEVPAWAPGVAAAALVVLAMVLLRGLRRQMQLLSDGRAAPAVVVGHRRVQHGQKVLKYEFPLMDGGVGKGRGGQTRKPAAVGSTITVVYDRDNPKRNAPYPFDLARVVR